MEGEELFQIYKRNLFLLGVETDDWDDLEVEEQEAWNRTAAKVIPA